MDTLNTIQFYCDVMCRSEPNAQHRIDNLVTYGSQGPSGLLDIVKSQEHLKQFFISYPQVFSVCDEHVSLQNWIVFHFLQKQWLRESLPHNISIPSVEIIISTIQFFCNNIYTAKYKSGLILKELFSKRMKAPVAIRTFVESRNQFVQFLDMYPMIFNIRNGKVYLTDLALSYKYLVVWVEHLVNMVGVEKLDMDDICFVLAKNNSVVNAAVGFYYNILANRKAVSISFLLRRTLASKVGNNIRNKQDIKDLLSSYPQIFTICGDKVFLTHLLPSHNCPKIATDNKSLNNSLKVRPLSENLEQLTVDFYSGVMNKLSELCSDVSKIPVDHLFYYIVDAPSDIKEFITSQDKLKNVLMKYPNIFNIDGDIVIVREPGISQSYIHKSVNNNVKTFGITGKVVNGGLDFYCNLINNSGGIININELLTLSKGQNSDTLMSLEELIIFLRAHPNVFIIKNDKVFLVNMLEDNNSTNKNMSLKSGHIDKNKLKAVVFYTRFIERQNNKLVPINNLIGHRGSASRAVQSVAKSPTEMKAFLSQFPERFTIVNDNVMISILNQDENITQDKEILTETNFENQQNAVDYFSKMLNHYGIGRVMRISALFEYKLKSSPVIQEASGSNIDQFKKFLIRHPDHFIVTNENVISKKDIPKWSNDTKYENKKFTDPLLVLIFNYFVKFTRNKSLFHVDHLYYSSGRYFVYSDYSPVFQNKSELLLFLKLFPHVFYVDYFRVVNIIADSWKLNIIRHSNKVPPQNNGKANHSICEKSVKPLIANGNVDLSNPHEPIVEAFLEEPYENIDTNPQITNRPRLNRFTFAGKKSRGKLKIAHKKNYISSSVSTESIDFDPMTVLDFDIEADLLVSNSDILEHDQVFWENQYNTYSKNIENGMFKPLTIEEIENQVFSQFTNRLHQGDGCKSKLEVIDKKPITYSRKVFKNHRYNEENYKFTGNFFLSEINKRSTMEALVYLNSKLWEFGRLQILKISDLFNSLLKSEVELTKYYCRDINEFRHFLFTFPLDFIVSWNNVMARKNKIDVNSIDTTEKESLALILCNFFDVYTQYNKCINVKMLYDKVAGSFVYIDQTKIFKCPYDLVVFLRMFPEIFFLENNIVRNIGERRIKLKDENEQQFPQFPKIEITLQNDIWTYIPESTSGWKNSVLEKTIVVKDKHLCRNIVENILKHQNVIAVDCEGVNLGVTGQLTLVQVSLENGQVFIFDILADRDMIDAGGLKDVLESKSIVKVIHDSCNDIANLYTEFNVKVNKIFDTRVAHHLIVNSGVINVQMNRRRKDSYNLIAIGFNDLCSQYGAPLNIEKDEMKNVYKKDSMIWARRPLPEDMLAYAALDVASLIQIYKTMTDQMNEKSQRLNWDISLKYSISNLSNKDLFFD